MYVDLIRHNPILNAEAEGMPSVATGQKNIRC